MNNQQNSRPRAILAPDDFPLIRKAIEIYIYNYQDSISEDEKRKLTNILHRLGRVHV